METIREARKRLKAEAREREVKMEYISNELQKKYDLRHMLSLEIAFLEDKMREIVEQTLEKVKEKGKNNQQFNDAKEVPKQIVNLNNDDLIRTVKICLRNSYEKGTKYEN